MPEALIDTDGHKRRVINYRNVDGAQEWEVSDPDGRFREWIPRDRVQRYISKETK
jgi:hypothetical protein